MPTLTLRSVKGVELTMAEVDANFTKLNTNSATATAAGSTQGTATAVTKTVTFVTSSSVGSGVVLDTPDDGIARTIVNHTPNTIQIYPAVGHTIDNGTVNAPLALTPGGAVDLIGTSTTNWTGVSIDIWDDENNTMTFPAHPSDPPAPPAGYVNLFAKNLGGRLVPAFKVASGLTSSLQPHMARNGWAQWRPTPGSTTVSAIGAAALTATGTATAASYATTSLHTRSTRVDYLVTVAATTAVAGYRIGTNIYRGQDGYHHIFRVAPATGTAGVSTQRFFCGMAGSTAAPTDVNPSTLTDIVGAGYDAADANWQIFFNDATGTATKVDTGIARPTTDRPGPYSVMIYCPPGGASLSVTFVDESTGTSFSTTATTDLLTPATACGPRAYHSVGGTSSVTGLTLFGGYMETDN